MTRGSCSKTRLWQIAQFHKTKPLLLVRNRSLIKDAPMTAITHDYHQWSKNKTIFTIWSPYHIFIRRLIYSLDRRNVVGKTCWNHSREGLRTIVMSKTLMGVTMFRWPSLRALNELTFDLWPEDINPETHDAAWLNLRSSVPDKR